MRYVRIDNWLTLILWGGIFCLVYAVSLFFTALNREEKSFVYSALRRMRRRRSS